MGSPLKESWFSFRTGLILLGPSGSSVELHACQLLQGMRESLVIGSLVITYCWAARRVGPQELSVCSWSLDRVKTMNNMKGRTLTLVPDGRGPFYLKSRNPWVTIIFEVVCFSVSFSVIPRNVVCWACPCSILHGNICWFPWGPLHVCSMPCQTLFLRVLCPLGLWFAPIGELVSEHGSTSILSSSHKYHTGDWGADLCFTMPSSPNS